MNLFIDSIANGHALARTNPIRGVMTICRRHVKEVPDCVHDETATMHSHNMVELAVLQKQPTVSSIVMYITEKSFFGSDSMVYLVDKMLGAQSVGSALMYHGVLHNNFYMHPPCAKYMTEEYYKLMLVPSDKRMDGMAFWDYLIDRLNKIVDRSRSYGNNAGADMGFKKCFTFCLTILQFDYEVSRTNNAEPLLRKCLNYNPERIMKNGGLNNMLNMLFSTECDLQVLAMDLAVLTNRIQMD